MDQDNVPQMLIDRYKCPIWIDREGNYHPITIIHERYLGNIINFLNRGIHYLSEGIDDGWRVLGMLNGEMAQMQVEGELEALEEKRLGVIYIRDIMLKEVDRRAGKAPEWDYGFTIGVTDA